MSLGNNIQKIRRNNNLTQEQFAQKFHVTRQTVSNWENDKNYPDLSSLKMISEEYGISFDELFKEDEEYIKSIDNTKRKMSIFKKSLIASLVIMTTVIIGFFMILHMAFKPTPDGKRINSDTNVKMLVDLPGATPSRAITFTTDKSSDDKNLNTVVEGYRESALGKVEGDIPCVKLEKNPKIVLHFQDLDYNNIYPNKIKSVYANLTNVISIHENNIKTKMKYSVKDGNISIDPAQIKYEKDEETGEIWYKMALTVEYRYKDKDYTSVTAVIVLDK